jgi:hypothetical protein
MRPPDLTGLNELHGHIKCFHHIPYHTEPQEIIVETVFIVKNCKLNMFGYTHKLAQTCRRNNIPMLTVISPNDGNQYTAHP